MPIFALVATTISYCVVGMANLLYFFSLYVVARRHIAAGKPKESEWHLIGEVESYGVFSTFWPCFFLWPAFVREYYRKEEDEDPQGKVPPRYR